MSAPTKGTGHARPGTWSCDTFFACFPSFLSQPPPNWPRVSVLQIQNQSSHGLMHLPPSVEATGGSTIQSWPPTGERALRGVPVPPECQPGVPPLQGPGGAPGRHDSYSHAGLTQRLVNTIFCLCSSEDQLFLSYSNWVWRTSSKLICEQTAIDLAREKPTKTKEPVFWGPDLEHSPAPAGRSRKVL